MDMTEQWLTTRGVAHHKETVPLDAINEKKSLANQARFDPIDSDTVAQYVVAMKAGDQFPPLLAYRRDGRLILMDGNHRYQAAKKAGAGEVVVWVIDDASDTVITELTYEANVRNGRPNDRAEREEHAAHLIAMGMGHKDAARITGLTRAQVSNAINARAARDRAKQLGVTAKFRNLPEASQVTIGRILFDEPFRRLALAASNDPGTFTSKRVVDIVRHMLECRSEAEMEAALTEAIRTTAPVVAGRRMGRTVPFAGACRKHLAALSKPPALGWEKALDSEDSRKELIGLMENARSALDDRINELLDV